ncbi:MAG TPA: PEP-CTERM sorting domain-containing protein, partial [Opitutales bacterium]|nr:PEP-CTERM sorting domain-containing protein [Opitutales bacterium]
DGPGVVEFNGTTGARVGAGAFVPYTGNADSVINPQGMRFGPSGNLYIADVTNSEVHIFSSTGTSLGTLTGDNVVQPTDVAFDASGNLYVVSGQGIGVSAGASVPFVDFVSTGTAATIGMNNPKGLAFASDGKLYVTDVQSDKIFLFDANGTFDSVFANLDTVTGGIFTPAYLTFGPNGDLYVSGTGELSGEIIGFHNGTYDGVLVTGLNNPGSLAFTPDAVPEPSTWILPAILAGLIGVGRRRKRQKA